MNSFYKGVYAKRLLAAMTEVADCSVHFLTNDIVGSTGYDFVAFLGFGHIVAELERTEVMLLLLLLSWPL